MIYRGTVKRGVVELEDGAVIPDGTKVNVEPLPVEEDQVAPLDDEMFRMGDLAVDTGIEDLATNIDHYLYGHPKVDRNG